MQSIKEADHITPFALAPRPLRNCPPSFSLQTSMRELPFITACALAIVMLLLPATWHVRSRNSGIILYVAWSLTGNIIYFVNSIIWAGNLRNPSPIWCDICMFKKPRVSAVWLKRRFSAAKLIVGLTVGLPCASLCIQRRLYLLSRVRPASFSPADVSPFSFDLIFAEFIGSLACTGPRRRSSHRPGNPCCGHDSP